MISSCVAFFSLLCSLDGWRFMFASIWARVLYTRCPVLAVYSICAIFDSHREPAVQMKVFPLDLMLRQFEIVLMKLSFFRSYCCIQVISTRLFVRSKCTLVFVLHSAAEPFNWIQQQRAIQLEFQSYMSISFQLYIQFEYMLEFPFGQQLSIFYSSVCLNRNAINSNENKI